MCRIFGRISISHNICFDLLTSVLVFGINTNTVAVITEELIDGRGHI